MPDFPRIFFFFRFPHDEKLTGQLFDLVSVLIPAYFFLTLNFDFSSVALPRGQSSGPASLEVQFGLTNGVEGICITGNIGIDEIVDPPFRRSWPAC